jgi:hypothetical protein
MTTNALGELCGIEAETADVVSYLLVGLACSCTKAFDLNQACQTYPVGTDITQVVKNRYSSSRDTIAKRCCEAQIAPSFSADVNTNGCCLLGVELDLLVEAFLIGFDGDYIIIATLDN